MNVDMYHNGVCGVEIKALQAQTCLLRFYLKYYVNYLQDLCFY